MGPRVRPTQGNERWPVNLGGSGWFEMPVHTGTEYAILVAQNQKSPHQIQKLIAGRQYNLIMGFKVSERQELNPLHFGAFGECYKVMREAYRRWTHPRKLETVIIQLSDGGNWHCTWNQNLPGGGDPRIHLTFYCVDAKGAMINGRLHGYREWAFAHDDEFRAQHGLEDPEGEYYRTAVTANADAQLLKAILQGEVGDRIKRPPLPEALREASYRSTCNQPGWVPNPEDATSLLYNPKIFRDQLTRLMDIGLIKDKTEFQKRFQAGIPCRPEAYGVFPAPATPSPRGSPRSPTTGGSEGELEVPETENVSDMETPGARGGRRGTFTRFEHGRGGWNRGRGRGRGRGGDDRRRKDQGRPPGTSTTGTPDETAPPEEPSEEPVEDSTWTTVKKNNRREREGRAYSAVRYMPYYYKEPAIRYSRPPRVSRPRVSRPRVSRLLRDILAKA